jgi:RNA polymerase sigma-70 factor (ECF subfamily)
VDDIDIVLMMMEGDPEGVRWLLRKYGSKVKAGLRCEFGHVLAAPELEEALNRGAFNAFRAAQSYDESRGSLRTWFYAIARNAARDILRSEERHQAEPLEHDPPWEPEREDEPPIDPRKDRLVRDLMEAVEALPRLQRAIIEADLASGEKADAKRLAQVHGSTVNTIYVSRSQAMQKLREAMRRKGHHVPSGTARRGMP